MSFALFVNGLLLENRLEERAKKPDQDFVSDLDEAIFHTCRGVVNKAKLYQEAEFDVRQAQDGPKCLGIKVSATLTKQWKKRAAETFKMVDQYKSMPQGKERDILRDRLLQRKIRMK